MNVLQCYQFALCVSVLLLSFMDWKLFFLSEEERKDGKIGRQTDRKK